MFQLQYRYGKFMIQIRYIVSPWQSHILDDWRVGDWEMSTNFNFCDDDGDDGGDGYGDDGGGNDFQN